MKNWNKICGIVAIFLGTFSQTQAQPAFIKPDTTFSYEEISVKKSISLPAARIFPLSEKFFTIEIPRPVYFMAAGCFGGIKVLGGYGGSYFPPMGFMCVQELKLQKLTRLPLFIRLGSLEQCNFLEGKR